MSLKSPRTKTVKRLFALSQNQCSFPSCPNLLVESGVVVGEICHIESNNGPRPNLDMTDEARHGFDNLILLCEKHHKIVDAKENEADFPVDLLKSFKKAHEEKSSTISDAELKSMSETFAVHINNNRLSDNASISTTINKIENVNVVQNLDELMPIKQRIRGQLKEINPEILNIIDSSRLPFPVLIDSSKLQRLASLKRQDPEFDNYFQYEENGSTAVGGGMVGGHILDIDRHGTLIGVNWNYHSSLQDM